MALFWPLLVFMICWRLEEVPFSWEGAVQFDRKGIRTSAPVSGPGAARLQPAGTRHPEPEARRNLETEASRNPEPRTRSQGPGTILHTSQEINVSHIFNVILRKENKDFIYKFTSFFYLFFFYFTGS